MQYDARPGLPYKQAAALVRCSAGEGTVGEAVMSTRDGRAVCQTKMDSFGCSSPIKRVL
jgi:hypothetical protein